MADLSNMVMCSCGSPTHISTSSTHRNPRRRFHCSTKKLASYEQGKLNANKDIFSPLE
ncbi:hypothetical protein R6Q57_016902 [Mikania cordata]